MINFSDYSPGVRIPVRLRKGTEAHVIVRSEDFYCDFAYPHSLYEGADFVDSVSNSGHIFDENENSVYDVMEIIEPKAGLVLEGFFRNDKRPSREDASHYGLILWRDSEDDELVIEPWDSDPGGCYDEWYPLKGIKFVTEESEKPSAARKCHKEAFALYTDTDGGFAMSFVKGYVTAKGFEFSEEDLLWASVQGQ